MTLRVPFRGAVLPLLILLFSALAARAAPDSPPGAPDLEQSLSRLRDLKIRGASAEALALADRLTVEHPESLRAHIARQDLHLEQGGRERLEREYGERAAATEATADDIFLYARLLDGRRAIVQLRRALKIDEHHFWALCSLGTEYAEQGRIKEAGDFLERAWKTEPDSAVAVNLLGWVAEREGNFHRAEMLYRESAALDASYALARVNLGILLVATRRAADAVPVLEEARKLDPVDPMATVGLGMAKAAQGRTAEALVHYQQAVDLPSNTLVSLNALGTAYLGIEQYDLAREAFDRARREWPDDVPTLLNLGYTQLLSGDGEGAIGWVRQALELEPGSAEAHYFLGLCEECAGRGEEAARAYLKAMDLDREDPDYPRALGMLYAYEENWKAAVSALQKAADLSENAPEVLLDLAFAYLGGGEARRALSAFEDVVEKDPGNLTAWMNIGLIHHGQLKSRTRALEAYAEYLDRGGKDPRVQKWVEELKGR